ncbi:uncharacterized protein LOC117302524 [Asterias rubens]|uniref:uncharacterized protein LOC117302524 n=1 Tax=Asterias rubens TaxID=7604 RepID=UPI001454F718|nr:uncharacterized protein LOC117302524 [Asterias rubens]
MDFTSWFNRSLLVVFILCSLDTTKLFGVDSQSINLMRLSPGGVIVEGVEVKLQCYVDRLAATHVIEWVRVYMDVGVIIARNGTSLDQRYELQTSRPPASTSGISIDENLVIKNISKTDTSFTCRIDDTGSEMMSNNPLLSSNINLNVHYFPSPMYPICFPNGPFTVQEGTLQHLSCTSEKGNPAVNVELLPTPSTAIYLWMFSDINNEARRFIILTLDETYNGYQFQCIIISDYFPGRSGSCTIGPITVTNMTTESIEDANTEMGSRTDNPTAMMTDQTSPIPSTDIPNCHCCELCESNEESINTSPTPLLVAFIIFLILFIVSLIINIFFLIKHRHLKITKEKETNVAKADPYMELQPTEDKNKVYMEPTTATTTTQDTYYQPVEVETDSPEDGYARPEGSTNTDYEAVSKPQSSAEKPYKNINN